MLLHDSANGLRNAGDIIFGHRRIQRQRDELVKDADGVRQVTAAIPECIPIVRMKVYRNEMNARSNVSARQLADDVVATYA